MLVELNWIETQVQIQFNTKIMKVWPDHEVTADGIAWDRYYSTCGKKKKRRLTEHLKLVSGSGRVQFTTQTCHDTLLSFTNTKTFYCFLKLSWCEKFLSLPFWLSQRHPVTCHLVSFHIHTTGAELYLKIKKKRSCNHPTSS